MTAAAHIQIQVGTTEVGTLDLSQPVSLLATAATGPPGPIGPPGAGSAVVISQTQPVVTEPTLWVELRLDNSVRTMWMVTP